MDLAVSTILLLYFLLPGIIFRRIYYTEEFSKEYFKESVSSFFVSTILPSTVIHIVCWQIVRRWYSLKTDVLSVLFSGSDDLNEVKTVWRQVYSRITETMLYFGLLIVVAALLGWLSRLIVRKTKLDRRIKLFRFQNEWHYIFSGEVLDFPRVPGKHEDIDFTYVDLLVETPEGSVLYMGILADYYLSKNGGIERICLQDVQRRFLNDELNPERKYYTLPGQFLIIPYDKVLNVHLTYYSVDVEDDPQLTEENQTTV